MKPNTPVTGRRFPAQRVVLTPVAAVELINRMQQVGAALTQAGVLKANPTKSQSRTRSVSASFALVRFGQGLYYYSASAP